MKKLIKNIKYKLYPLPFNKELYLKNPFQFLPEKQTLSQEESSWLKTKEKKKEWNGDDFIKMNYLRIKKGCSKKHHEQLIKQLDKLIKQAKSMDLMLPKNFIKFIQSRDYLSRVKMDSNYCDLSSKIRLFPEDENFHTLTFWVDQQDCFRCSLVFDKKGNHCVVADGFPYWDTDLKYIDPNELVYETNVCAESIEGFIAWLSLEKKEANETIKNLLNEVS